jgi:hypothetical protein
MVLNVHFILLVLQNTFFGMCLNLKIAWIHSVVSY